MTERAKDTDSDLGVIIDEERWPGIDSRFRLIVVAALRSKQLLRGAIPRVAPDARRQRNTSIALAEVKQGLVSFTLTGVAPKGVGVEEGRAV